MENKLTSLPKLQGLSRNRILIALLVLFAIIGIATFIGTLSNNGDSDSKGGIFDSSQGDKQFKGISSQSTKELIAQIDKNQLNSVDQQATKTKIPELNESIPPIVPTKDSSTKLIGTDDAKGVDSAIYTAKSLMYSKKFGSSGSGFSFGDDNDSGTNSNNGNSIGSGAVDQLTSGDIGGVANSFNKSLGGSSNSNNNDSNDAAKQALAKLNNLNANNPTAKSSPLPSFSNDLTSKLDASTGISSKHTSFNKDEAYLDARIQDPKSPYELKAGSVIPSTSINGINSDLPGEVVAQVRQNVYDSATRRYLLIPQGSRLIGLYDSNIIYGQERLLVAWNRLIYPDGSSISLHAMPGTDLEGYAGFHDQVDNKYVKIFGSSFIVGIITAGMQYSQNNTNPNVQTGGVGINVTDTNPTVGQTLSGSLGQQLGQTGLAITNKNLNVAPTLIIRPNYPFNLMTTADMILRPYGKPKSSNK